MKSFFEFTGLFDQFLIGEVASIVLGAMLARLLASMQIAAELVTLTWSQTTFDRRLFDVL